MKDRKSGQTALFGTDGIRGKANVYPMSADLVLRLGQAIGVYFKEHYKKPRILIGKDTRRSGYMLEQALSSGICSVGVDTFFLGPLPTPGIAYLTRGMRANAGIVISASHNPYSDNGIKIFSADGYKLPDEVEKSLEDLVYTDSSKNLAVGAAIGTTVRIDDAVGQYAVFLKEQFPKKLTLDGVRLVLDCANGAAYRVAPKVFEELGAQVHLVGSQPNGLNINEDSGALYPKALQNKVLETGADLGIALDGDADRCVLVDEKGEILDGDHILAFSADHYKKTGRLAGDKVVATVMSNMGLEVCLTKLGVQLVRSPVGDRYVVEAMREQGLNLGGEQSGHLIFRDSSTTGDGILAALVALEIMLERQAPLSTLRTVMDRYPQVLVNFQVAEKVPLSQLPELEMALADFEATLQGSGRVLFRYSGTESKARVMVEGQDSSKISKIAEDLQVIAQRCISQYGTTCS